MEIDNLMSINYILTELFTTASGGMCNDRDRFCVCVFM